jgi:hypothetical protein
LYGRAENDLLSIYKAASASQTRSADFGKEPLAAISFDCFPLVSPRLRHTHAEGEGFGNLS